MKVRTAKKILKKIYGPKSVKYLKDRKLFRVGNKGSTFLCYL